MTLKKVSLWFDPKQIAELKAIGKRMGGLKYSQLLRMAAAEFIEKHKKTENESYGNRSQKG